MDNLTFQAELEKLCRRVRVVRAGRVIEVREYVGRAMPPVRRERYISPTRTASSSLRARRMVRWLSSANGEPGTAYFFTATFADDIKDYDTALECWKRFRRLLKKEFENVRYIAVPEIQPRSGRWHFHAVFCGLPELRQMRQFYGVYGWAKHFTDMWAQACNTGKIHRCDIQVARSVAGVCGYLAKYLNKDVGGVVPAGRRNYFAGGKGLVRPIELEGEQHVPDRWPDFVAISHDRYGAKKTFARYVDK